MLSSLYSLYGWGRGYNCICNFWLKVFHLVRDLEKRVDIYCIKPKTLLPFDCLAALPQCKFQLWQTHCVTNFLGFTANICVFTSWIYAPYVCYRVIALATTPVHTVSISIAANVLSTAINLMECISLHPFPISEYHRMTNICSTWPVSSVM
jgi:hypothetical protein